jgi:hypothetical protein
MRENFLAGWYPENLDRSIYGAPMSAKTSSNDEFVNC